MKKKPTKKEIDEYLRVRGPDLCKGIFAIPPEGCETYLTPGKKYQVTGMWGETAFKIVDDEGGVLFCLWRDCSHLKEQDWGRIEDENT